MFISIVCLRVWQLVENLKIYDPKHKTTLADRISLKKANFLKSIRDDVVNVFRSWKFVNQSLTYCLWVLCAWNFENRLKSHNVMTLNIKPCSKPCAGRKGLNKSIQIKKNMYESIFPIMHRPARGPRYMKETYHSWYS